MKCLFGIYKKDGGKITFDGKEINFTSAKDALENGVSMVHQELNQVTQRNVLDNIWLGRFPMKGMFVDEKKMYDDTVKIFKDLDIEVDPRMKVADLSVSQRQMIEIAKAVSYNSKIIVMDEPTSSLTENEVQHLFRIINKLRDKGCGIVYISHKMEEIKEICDDITIMRDGKWVATDSVKDLRIINKLRDKGCGIVYISHKMEEIKEICDDITIMRDGKWVATDSVKDLTTDQIINMMVGRDLTNRFPPKDNEVKEVILKVENLSALHQPSLKEASFELHKGEILGVAGLVGSKRTDIVETIFGMRERATGKIILNGKEVKNRTPGEAIRNGFALVTEERRATGIFSMLDIKVNSIVSNIDHYKNKLLGLLDNKKMVEDTRWVIDSMRVKTPSQSTSIGSLSGGNQQKVILGRWLLTEPDVLMLDEPTRGIDVGAKYEIYQLMIELAKKDKGIIMISSEMPELLGVTDRILVMSNGRVAGIVNTKETTQEEILALSAKYL